MGDFAAVASWQKSSFSGVMAASRAWQPCNSSSRGSNVHSGRTVSMEVKKQKMKMALPGVSASTSTYSSRISTNIPLYEHPGASFDRYLEDKPRVFKAIFPDTKRSQRLTEEEWRIHMLPTQFLYLTVVPVVDVRLRCKSAGIDYPDGVSSDITKVLELDILRWELKGLDDIVTPSTFSLLVKGEMYADRRTKPSLKGRLQMSMSFAVPPVLALVPEDIRRGVAESLLQRLIGNMKHKVNGSLIADYSQFKREILG
ncbi:hypothetical protein DCAR_0312570 [Daucus carota subsp. sativus]|uniref:Uncharacterized protein n=1 Tax=Daucus carota subsp. sativus TaxID=79200 RepID=A0A161WUB3_DAUCS|nr:PREDICTED: uncharacterized protein LOC108211714 [Daucus carota subsp. sativus]WOG93289.1 hypothetical protein DCAR_0312570 [Daucus carota subsp. sativus]